MLEDDYIYTYIRKNYGLNFSTMVTYKVLDKISNEYIGLKEFMVTMKMIFGVSDDEFQDIWEQWVDEELSSIGEKIDRMKEIGLIVENVGVNTSTEEPVSTIDMINELINTYENNG